MDHGHFPPEAPVLFRSVVEAEGTIFCQPHLRRHVAVDVIHQNIWSAHIIVLLGVVGVNLGYGNVGLGPDLDLDPVQARVVRPARHLLEELHARYLHLHDSRNTRSLSVSRHVGDGWHSEPDDPADPVVEDDAPYHVEVTDGEFNADFACNSMKNT